MTDATPTRDWYERRIAACQKQLASHRRQDDRLSRARVATFLPAIALAAYAVFWSTVGWPWVLAACVFLAAFIAVVRRHERVLHEADEWRQRLAMNKTQLARVERRWDDIPVRPVEVPADYQSVAGDLDLFGRASLYQFLSLAHTPFGEDTLRDWLIIPATPREIVERQQAAAFLAPQADLREDIDLRGRLLGASRDGTLAFVEWAESSPCFADHPWLAWITRVSAVAMLVALVVGLTGIVPAVYAFLAVVAALCFNVALIVIFAPRLYDVLGRVTSQSHDVRQYHPLLEAIAALPDDVPFFAQFHAHMGATKGEPLAHLDSLMRLVAFANLRRDGLFGVPYYLSQFFLLTDFHVVAFLGRWQSRHGHSVRHWLAGVGRLEAISSLATLAHDHPQWCTPVIDDAPQAPLAAKGLAHPLLADGVSVGNDVVVGPSGTFVLVTGSNMSGKSTLLRAVGLNATLAQAGALAAARELRLPPLELTTCMRVRDSLADGVSFFMAELRRLKEIVDQSHHRPADRPRQLLYLFDEILQGTNSVERHIAVERVIGRLVESGAIGMVSTHDLELASSPALRNSCRVVHFRESFTNNDGRQQMTFDYQLRPGVAPTTNALKLLDFVGLGD